MTSPLAPNQVAARLDRLPVSRFHYRFLALIGLGAWFDYYDNFVAGTLAVTLPAAGVLPATKAGQWLSPLGGFMAALPLGMFLGTIFLGMASDYIGRRWGFVIMLLLYSLASFAGGAGYYPLTAVAGSSAGLALLLVTRFLAGAGIGAENVIIDAYVTEVMPSQIRGRAVALTQAFAFTAVPAAALLSRVLVTSATLDRWWLLLVIGSLGALLSWYFRRQLPESPRWSACVGRHAEAAANLARIEAAVSQATGQPLKDLVVPAQPVPSRPAFRAIWQPPYRNRTLLLVFFHWLQTVGYYGFMHWLPTLLEAKGFARDDALTMQLGAFLLAPVGPLLAVGVSERWQRKGWLASLGTGLGVLIILFGWLTQAWLLTLVAAAVVVGLNWFSAVFHAYQAELYPSEARATGVGFTYAWSRASMVVVGALMPGLIQTQLSLAFAVMAGALFGMAVLVAVFGPRTNQLALESVSPSA